MSTPPLAGYARPEKPKPVRRKPRGLLHLMPSAAFRPCRHQGCTNLVSDGTGYCQAHQADRKIGTFADPRRGSRHQRGYGTAWDKQRERILRRDNGLCQVCLARGLYSTATEVDHIINKASGGTDADGNLQAICKPCHQAKTAMEKGQGRGGSKV